MSAKDSTYSADVRLVQDALTGRIDHDHPALPGRLVVMLARYRGRGDAGMLDLIGRALEVHAEAVARAEEAADRAYLEGLIDGSGDLLSEETFPRLAPLFAKYAEGTEMFALLERAAGVFGDAAQELAAWVLAGIAIDEAQSGSIGDYE